MRNVRTALVAGLALLAVPVLVSTPASAASTTTNSGHHAFARASSVHHTFAPTTKAASFDVWDQPVSAYTDSTCDFDLSRFTDFKQGMHIKDCGDITLSSGDVAEKRSVPNSWGTWGSPPDTETDTPNIVFPLGLATYTITSSVPLTTFGLEAEPDPFEVHTISLTYYTGPNGTGDVVGTVTRDADGNFGAKLFAATTDTPFQSVVLTSDIDFAFAQMRVAQ